MRRSHRVTKTLGEIRMIPGQSSQMFAIISVKVFKLIVNMTIREFNIYNQKQIECFLKNVLNIGTNCI